MRVSIISLNTRFLVAAAALCLIAGRPLLVRAGSVVSGSTDTAPAPRPSQEAGKPAGPLPSLPPPDPDAFRDLPGYRGPYYRADVSDLNRTDVSGHEVVVLPQTLFQWRTSDWKVSGLIRNETGSDVNVTAVTARLLDSRGNGLGAAAAWVPLDRLRPGEPAPFVVTTAIPANSVSSIDWSIEQVPSAPPNRPFQIIPFWTQPFGDRQRHTGYPFADPANPPYPYVVFGSLRNTSSATVDAARLLGAWLDEKGRVVYVDWLSFIPATDLAQRQESITLPPGQGQDYIYQSIEPAVGAQLSKAALALWGMTR